jgi:hypothetical protein
VRPLRVSIYIVFVALTLAVVGPPLRAAAQDGPHRAGLVVTHDDGATVTRCVSFAEDVISGYELLARSGLELAVEANATGATVCSLDGQGCAFPEQSCFCKCQGSPCVYWSYWRLGADGWTYQTIGAGGTQVTDGAVEGWRWGAGTVDSATEPRLLTLAEICGEATGTEQAQTTVATTDSPPAAAPGGVTAIASPPMTPEATPDTTATVSAATAALGVVLAAVIVGPLVVAVVYFLRRRARSQGGSA